MTLVSIEEGQVVRLNNIFFESGKFKLLEDSFAELNRVVQFLMDNPNVNIQINGHTDDVGTDEKNFRLSLSRAAAVADYIISKGIQRSRLNVKVYGKTQPVVSNMSAESRSQNRRVEFVILFEKQ